MIKVNLLENSGRKPVKASVKGPSLAALLPVLLAFIPVLAALGGYLWYANLSAHAQDLNSRIAAAEAQRAQLETIIRQDQIYESRKAALENRIEIIGGLQRRQVNPVMSLDILADAIHRTQFVWLSNLEQNNTVFSMSGVGTSVNAIADFVTNLEATGYFRNINLVNAQDSQGNFTFNMTSEYAPPILRTPGIPAFTGEGAD